MEPLLISTGVVALAEIGDKTQLLAFILAARFKKPLPIILGILVATLVNHGLAGALGAWITASVDADILRWVLGVSFIAMAVWTLIPDKIEEEETAVALKLGVFGATLVTFFLAEMGDKTQIATVASGRNGRQDPNCHGRFGCALRRTFDGGCRHHAWHVDCRCTRCVFGRQIVRPYSHDLGPQNSGCHICRFGHCHFAGGGQYLDSLLIRMTDTAAKHL